MDASRLQGSSGSTVSSWTNLATLLPSDVTGVSAPATSRNGVPATIVDTNGARGVFFDGGTRFQLGTLGSETWYQGEVTIFVVVDPDKRLNTSEPMIVSNSWGTGHPGRIIGITNFNDEVDTDDRLYIGNNNLTIQAQTSA